MVSWPASPQHGVPTSYADSNGAASLVLRRPREAAALRPPNPPHRLLDQIPPSSTPAPGEERSEIYRTSRSDPAMLWPGRVIRVEG
jgi:hypothetical protein